MSRIVAGSAGGLRLANVPRDNTRPTTDRVKEAVFSRLEAYEVLEAARVLDTFAGSGALGCEALSRGSAHTDFIDHYPKAVAVIEKNLGAVLKANPAATGRVHRMTAKTFLQSYSGPAWDLVFLDPPYDVSNGELEEVLELLQPHLGQGAVLVLERSSRTPEPTWPQGLEKFSEKKYGETTIYYAEPVEADQQ